MNKSATKRSFEERYSEFKKRFGTEERCRDHIFQWRWPDGFKCPSCGHDEYSFHTPRSLYECKKCKKQTSITAGTFFDKTRTSLRTWFHMIFLVTNGEEISTKGLQKNLKMGSYETALRNRKKIETVLERILFFEEDYKELMRIVEIRDIFSWGERNSMRLERRLTVLRSQKKPSSRSSLQPSPTQTQDPAEGLLPDAPTA